MLWRALATKDRRIVIAKTKSKFQVPVLLHATFQISELRIGWRFMNELSNVDWRIDFRNLDAEAAASKFTKGILDAARKTIPQKRRVIRAVVIEQRMLGYLRRKPAASGTLDLTLGLAFFVIFRKAYLVLINKIKRARNRNLCRHFRAGAVNLWIRC